MASTAPDLLAGSIVPTLVRLASPNVLGLLAQTLTIGYDGYIVARLGTDALAAVALVFPLSMLMVQLSRAAMGGGVASAVARALGAGSVPRAAAVAWHGMVIELGLGVIVGSALLAGGPPLYGALGGRGQTLELAQGYALPLFAGAAATWLHNGLASVHVGSGNMRLPALCLVASALSHVALCPALVFGFGPIPPLGIAGASLSFVALNAFFACMLALPLLAGRAAVPLRWVPLRWAATREVLRVGLPASVSPFISNGNVIVLTGYAGTFGTVTLAGYGVGARLEYLLIPLVFGFGAALLAMVGRNIGAGQHARAARIAWTGSMVVAGMTGVIGVVLAVFPDLWTRWFIADAVSPVRAAANLYLHIVGGFYAPFGFGLAFFFASQGAGRLTWPLAGSVGRLGVAVAGGGIAVSLQSPGALYGVIGLSFLVYALVPGVAFRLGAWAPEGDHPARG
jgi:putative MATE family efflux protein